MALAGKMALYIHMYSPPACDVTEVAASVTQPYDSLTRLLAVAQSCKLDYSASGSIKNTDHDGGQTLAPAY